jgi:hypothetical protein
MTLITGVNKNYLKSNLMAAEPGKIYYGSWDVPKKFEWTDELQEKTYFKYNPCWKWGSVKAAGYVDTAHLPLDVLICYDGSGMFYCHGTIGSDMIVRRTDKESQHK